MGKEPEEDSAPDLRSRLAQTWKFDRPRFWVILYEELRPYCMRWLSRKFESTSLCEEDFEDCFTDAVEGLMRRDSGANRLPDELRLYQCAERCS